MATEETNKNARKARNTDVSGGDVGEGAQSRASSRAADDPHYNLISILYHALKGADLYDEYISDAEAAGDTELRDFFEQVQQEENRRAQKARQLLTARLASGAPFSSENE